MNVLRPVAAAALAGLAVVTTGQGPAAAAVQFAPDTIPKLCAFATIIDPDCNEFAQGTINWGNRTATITIKVGDKSSGGTTRVFFDAFAGSTKVDSDVRSAGGVTVTHTPFVIGDPNRPGGINRIRTQVCYFNASNQRVSCSTQWNDIRD
ncbi:hypothetical protein [Kribbella sp. NPDC051770]|uniref:hypothetical protein n=1 Tax=Kribbella sp. NPDC051770 TaxID=3155413 RepID=UPI00342AC936